MELSGAESLLECLKVEGVKYVFGNPGTTEVAILDALVDRPEINYILTLHESVAVGMADGFARAGGGIGFVNVHTALGLSNAIGNLYSAYKDGTPLVLTIANKDSRVLGREMFSEVDDLLGMTRQFTKRSWQVLRPERIAEDIIRSFKIAATPPTGPVFLSIPEDFLALELDVEIPPSQRFVSQPQLCAESENMETAIKLLLAAKQPLLIAGTEVSKAKAVKEAVELAELLGLPVLNEGRQSLSTMNFPSNHPLYRGGFDPQSEYVQSCDLLFAVGCELFVQNSFSKSDDILKTIKTIHMHSNPAKIGKLYPAEVPIVSNVKNGLLTVIELAKNLTTPDITALIKQRFDKLKAEWNEKEAHKAKQIKAGWGKTPIRTAQLVKELNDIADSSAIIVDEAIRSSRPLLQHYHFTQPGTYLRSPAGYLGWGAPAALGVKLAQPNRQVIALVGDGAFIISNQALWTAARYNIPVTFIVCNNREYRAVKDAAVRFKGKAVEKNLFIGSSIDNPAPDLSRIAEGFGVSATTVTEPDEIKPSLENALQSQKPWVLDVRIEQ